MTRIKIPLRLPSLNEYIDKCRSNRYSGAGFKKSVECDIMWFLKPIPEITKPCKIHFIWYEQTKRRDKDNVAFAKKFILDALQVAGKLPNDNNRYVLGFSDDFVYGHGDGVIVEIEEVENEQ